MSATDFFCDRIDDGIRSVKPPRFAWARRDFIFHIRFHSRHFKYGTASRPLLEQRSERKNFGALTPFFQMVIVHGTEVATSPDLDVVLISVSG